MVVVVESSSWAGKIEDWCKGWPHVDKACVSNANIELGISV